jgi:hypothetical protein
LSERQRPPQARPLVPAVEASAPEPLELFFEAFNARLVFGLQGFNLHAKRLEVCISSLSVKPRRQKHQSRKQTENRKRRRLHRLSPVV